MCARQPLREEASWADAAQLCNMSLGILTTVNSK